MRILTITGIATVALLASGLVTDASAQGHGRGQDKNRSRGLVRAREVANENSRLLRGDDSRLRRARDDRDSDSDSDSDSDKGHKVKKNKNKSRRNGDVIGQSGRTLPSGVCVDANGDGLCDLGTGTDQRRPRTRTDNGSVILDRRRTDRSGVILGRRTPGNILTQQLGLYLLQRAAQSYAYRQR